MDNGQSRNPAADQPAATVYVWMMGLRQRRPRSDEWPWRAAGTAISCQPPLPPSKLLPENGPS